MKKSFKLFLFISVSFYLISYGLVVLQECKLEKNLNSYDLNHNGNFEKNERTVEMQKAMRKVIADNARTFAPFTLIPVSLIIGLLSTIGIFSFKKARTLINRNYT